MTQTLNSKSKTICLLGASGVGKTSLVKRFVEKVFDESYRTTIGTQLYDTSVTCDEELVKLNIYDLAGKDDPRQSYHDDSLESADGYMLVADVTRPDTLDVAKGLISATKKQNLLPDDASDTKELPFVLLVNKQDLLQSSAVTNSALEIFGGGTKILETSAKTGEKVTEAFEYLAKQMLELDRRCGSQTTQLTDEGWETPIDLNDPKSYEPPCIERNSESAISLTFSEEERTQFNNLFGALDSLVLERCTNGHAFRAMGEDVPDWALCLIKKLPNQPHQELWTEIAVSLKQFMSKARNWWSEHRTGKLCSGWKAEKWKDHETLDLEFTATAIGHRKWLVIKRLAPSLRAYLQLIQDNKVDLHRQPSES
ncbi:MAG: GTP-binding protein [Nitrospira sp.]|nr:GTP-binding protein [Nitrospira sp.]